MLRLVTDGDDRAEMRSVLDEIVLDGADACLTGPQSSVHPL
ncbi:MAG TPA: hypothetical protein VK988_01965 [Acidimicrobiales bacterium]|nr:hypothetical protein [Acidimicrobiales bacterium]